MRSFAIITSLVSLALIACDEEQSTYDVSSDTLVRDSYQTEHFLGELGRNEFAESARRDPQKFCEVLPRSAAADLEDLMTYGRLTYGSGTLTTTLLIEGSAMHSSIIWVRHDDRGVGHQSRRFVDSCYRV